VSAATDPVRPGHVQIDSSGRPNNRTTYSSKAAKRRLRWRLIFGIVWQNPAPDDLR
jgi:hypothetical protein